MKRSDLPTTGLVFWPVGTGDSATILVADEDIIQVDLNHLIDAEGDADPRFPVIDELVELLPIRNGKPYLAVFVATHADNDHCRGFKRLLEDEDVVIGELWFTPRLVADIDAEDPDSLSEDAAALRDEALRRLEIYQDSTGVASGDRLRVIGYHEFLKGEFIGLDEVVSVPGTEVTVFDGVDHDGNVRLFIHSPFKDDMESTERNRTSIGVHVTLRCGNGVGRVLLLGDLDYEPIKRLLESTADQVNKEWDVYLAAHHCSKSVMYERVDGSDVLRSDVLDLLDNAKAEFGWIVSSSGPIPASNAPGDNPPHAKAKNRYSERCDEFLCTGEHPDNATLAPIVFEVTADGIAFLGTAAGGESSAPDQVRASRGNTEPVAAAVGFGCR